MPICICACIFLIFQSACVACHCQLCFVLLLFERKHKQVPRIPGIRGVILPGSYIVFVAARCSVFREHSPCLAACVVLLRGTLRRIPQRCLPFSTDRPASKVKASMSASHIVLPCDRFYVSFGAESVLSLPTFAFELVQLSTKSTWVMKLR